MTNLESIARKITGILFAQQSLASAGFIAASTLNSIVGKELSQHATWAGVPTAVYLLAGAFAAFMWGYVYDAIGRRNGLTTGLSIGVVGSGIAFYAIAIHSFTIFLGGMVLMGIANAAVQLGRFAAAEVNRPEHRGRAISNVVIGGTVGSVVGPFVAGPAGNIIGSWGIDELAGAYLVSLVLFAIAAVVVFIGLRPDPREIAKQVAEEFPDTIVRSRVVRNMFQIFSQPAAKVALVSMVLGQMVMVLVMVITSLHMRGHHHDLTNISMVISSHTFGMYAFSIISGRLADQWGRGPVIIVGSATLVLACIAATISPDVLPLGVALFLLGLGWNFCFVGGSTLLADQLSPAERARTQGFNDLLVGLASAVGSLGSGFIFAALGYNTMALVSAAFALIPLILASFWTLKRVRKTG
ncbi:MAG: MFS transporter [Anaerolineales bacterium]|uniref:MFS transporter n=1 Tax=Candidatus Villigracilis proximus TaxID=3140683 RepID=UPI00313579DF|nr:MFS transporter [Anaerolineales bacterium]